MLKFLRVSSGKLTTHIIQEQQAEFERLSLVILFIKTPSPFDLVGVFPFFCLEIVSSCTPTGVVEAKGPFF